MKNLFTRFMDWGERLEKALEISMVNAFAKCISVTFAIIFVILEFVIFVATFSSAWWWLLFIIVGLPLGLSLGFAVYLFEENIYE